MIMLAAQKPQLPLRDYTYSRCRHVNRLTGAFYHFFTLLALFCSYRLPIARVSRRGMTNLQYTDVAGCAAAQKRRRAFGASHDTPNLPAETETK